MLGKWFVNKIPVEPEQPEKIRGTVRPEGDMFWDFCNTEHRKTDIPQIMNAVWKYL